MSEDPSRGFARTQGRRDLFVREPPLELQQDDLLSLGWQLGEGEAYVFGQARGLQRLIGPSWPLGNL